MKINLSHILFVVSVVLFVCASALDAQYINTRIGTAAQERMRERLSDNSGQSNVSPQMQDLSKRISNTSVSGYYGGSAMNISLPSETMSNFARNTVGVSDVISGRQYQPRPYYNSSMSSYLFGKPLSNDLSSTTSTQLYRAYSSTTDYRRAGYETRVTDYSAASERYASDLSPSAMTRMTIKFDDSSDGTFVYGHSTAGLADSVTGAPRDQYSVLFGYMDYDSNRQLDKALIDQALEKQGEIAPSDQLDLQSQPGNTEDIEGTDAQSDDRRVSGDVFVSMIMGVSSKFPQNEYESLRISPEQRSDAYTVSTVQIKGMTLERFGGARQDNFNRMMRSGDSLLFEREFYRAANIYELAANYNSNNPLTRLGSCVAYLGAGESYKAALLLRQVLAMYPDIARVKVDLDSMIGDDLSRTRLSQLKSILAEGSQEDVSLLTLMAFIKLNSGQLDQARQLAEQLKTMPGSTAEIMAFANRVSPVTENVPSDEQQ